MTFFDDKQEVLNIELTPYGRKLLAQGKLNPTYYAFFDHDVTYDPNYIESGSSEYQYEAENRIQDRTPRKKVQRSKSARTDQVTKDLDLYEHSFNLENALGTSAHDSQKAPRLELTFLQGEVNGTITKFLSTSSGPSFSYHQDVKITQIPTDIEIQTAIAHEDRLEKDIKFKPDFELSTNNVHSDGSTVVISPEQIFLLLDEENTIVLNENFDIEVFEVLDLTGSFGEEVLKPLSFVRPVEYVVDGKLIDRGEAFAEAGRSQDGSLNVTNEYVEYYFNVNTDVFDEISDSEICQAAFELKKRNILVDLEVDCPDLIEVPDLNIYESDAVEIEDCP